MKSKPSTCYQCPLASVTHWERNKPVTRVMTGFVEGWGIPHLGVTFVGEAAGAKEEMAGEPFRSDAQAGAILERAFRRIKVSRSQVSIGNILSCRPPNNILSGANYELAAISHCSSHRDRFIDASIGYATAHAKQSVVVALGDVAFRTLTGLDGDRLSISYARGYPVMTERYGLVMGTYHPAFVARKRKYFGVLVEDLIKAFKWAREGFVEFPRTYLTHPDESQKRDFRDRYLAHPELYTLSYDLESDDIPPNRSRDQWPTIRSWQLSLGPGEGIFLDAVEDREIYAPCLASEGDKIGHNCFHKNTSVWMANGSWKPIWKVKNGDVVKSMSNGVLVNRLANSFKTMDDRPWVEVVIDGAHSRGASKWGDAGVVCTPDHEWITPGGTRVRADKLVPGCQVLLPQQGSQEVLFGSLLGDGHALEARPLFRCSHTNMEWAKAKANCLGTRTHPRVQKTGYKPGTVAYEFEISIPAYWRDRFYRRDKTRKWNVPDNWALAVWYCDDGTSAHKNGEPYSARLSLHKYAAQEDEIRSWFASAFGSSSMEDGSIALHRGTSLRFWDCIAEYVHPSMEYKLPIEFRGRYNGWMETKEALIGHVLRVVPRVPKANVRTKYCLVVDETHTFFTRGGLVANCWDFDDEVARANGLRINGRRDDSLWMFAHYQPDIATEDAKADPDDDDDFRLSTSAGLQFVASFCGMDFLWKNLNRADPRFYGIADVDACSRIKVTLPPLMKSLGIWGGYEMKVKLKPVLTAAENRGLWYDLDGRDVLHSELQTVTHDLDKKLQAYHPDALKNLLPKDGYARTPSVGDKIRLVNESFEWLDEKAASDATATSSTDEQEDEKLADGYVAVTGLWRPMTKRKFAVRVKEMVKSCACGIRLEIPRVSAKTGKPIKPEVKYEYLANCDKCHGAGKYATYKDVVEERWARLLPFKPSNKQIVRYMTFKGHKVPFDRKLKRETTNAEKMGEVARATHDPLYQTMLDVRTVSKIDSTYVTGQWRPTREWDEYYDGVKRHVGLIQTNFNFAPATGQKASRGPNTQNGPKHIRNENLRHLDLPTRWRNLIIAPPDHYVAEFDLKSAHAQTLAFEAGCKDYLRLAKRDVHTYMASMILWKRGVIKAPVMLNVSDDDLGASLADMKASVYLKIDGSWQRATESHKRAYYVESSKTWTVTAVIVAEVRDTQAKPAILGYGFGMGGNKLWEKNKDSFENDIEAQEVLALIDEAFPELPQYRLAATKEAHDNKHLVSKFEYLRWFWDVYHFVYNPDNPNKWDTKHGTDYEDAMAFRPANDAFGYLDAANLRLDVAGWLERGRFVNTIHDSLIFYLHKSIFDVAVDEITRELEKPSNVLVNETCPGGLSIEVEVAADKECKLGASSWGQVKKLKR